MLGVIGRKNGLPSGEVASSGVAPSSAFGDAEREKARLWRGGLAFGCGDRI
jgi:hypothetical protein